VTTLVLHDDIITRTCVANAAKLSGELAARKPEFKKDFSEDFNSFKKRVASLWAPAARSHKLWDPSQPTRRAQSEEAAAAAALQETTSAADAADEKGNADPAANFKDQHLPPADGGGGDGGGGGGGGGGRRGMSPTVTESLQALPRKFELAVDHVFDALPQWAQWRRRKGKTKSAAPDPPNCSGDIVPLDEAKGDAGAVAAATAGTGADTGTGTTGTGTGTGTVRGRGRSKAVMTSDEVDELAMYTRCPQLLPQQKARFHELKEMSQLFNKPATAVGPEREDSRNEREDSRGKREVGQPSEAEVRAGQGEGVTTVDTDVATVPVGGAAALPAKDGQINADVGNRGGGVETCAAAATAAGVATAAATATVQATAAVAAIDGVSHASTCPTSGPDPVLSSGDARAGVTSATAASAAGLNGGGSTVARVASGDVGGKINPGSSAAGSGDDEGARGTTVSGARAGVCANPEALPASGAQARTNTNENNGRGPLLPTTPDSPYIPSDSKSSEFELIDEEDANAIRVVVPGKIVHIYHVCGVHRASLVDHRFVRDVTDSFPRFLLLAFSFGIILTAVLWLLSCWAVVVVDGAPCCVHTKWVHDNTFYSEHPTLLFLIAPAPFPLMLLHL
jgi:hypothetical protein